MHPFILKVKKYIDKYQLIQRGDRLLLACSGGADSVAAVLTFHELKKLYNLQLGIVHTDHQLRGAESAEDMHFVEQLAIRLDISFYGTTLEVPSRVEAEGGNVQVICLHIQWLARLKLESLPHKKRTATQFVYIRHLLVHIKVVGSS